LATHKTGAREGEGGIWEKVDGGPAPYIESKKGDNEKKKRVHVFSRFVGRRAACQAKKKGATHCQEAGEGREEGKDLKFGSKTGSGGGWKTRVKAGGKFVFKKTEDGKTIHGENRGFWGGGLHGEKVKIEKRRGSQRETKK